jgi:1-acyl-sn-glycerol-3-phosphate acyltransferase
MDSFMRRAARSAGDWGNDPAGFDAEFVRRQLAVVETMIGPGRYFEFEAHGWENLPSGSALLVGNHSGGTTVLDGWGFFRAWYGRHGTDRPLFGLAHEGVFATATTGAWFSRSGILRASPENARKVLVDHHGSLIVMPGGDQDVWRPSAERHKVHFAGRKGYARTAILNGAPVIPVAHVGAHDTLYVLTSGSSLAKRLGIPRIARAQVFPVHLSLPWGLAIGPWPHLPPPTQLQYALGAPIQPPLCGADGPNQADVDDLDATVRHALQSLLDDLAQRRRPLSWDARRVGTSALRAARERLTRGVPHSDF